MLTDVDCGWLMSTAVQVHVQKHYTCKCIYKVNIMWELLLDASCQ